MLLLTTIALAADRYVLVRDGAMLQAGQDRIALKTANHEPAAMQLLGEEGDVLTVRPLRSGDKGHCSIAQLRPSADLKLQVSRADTESVLTRSLSQSWKDGTSVRYAAGSWLTLERDGAWKVTVEGASVVLKVPIDAIGSSYEIDTSFPAWSATSHSLRIAAPIRTGGGTLTHKGNVTDAVIAEDTTDAGTRVEVIGRCLDVVGDVATTDVQGSIGGIGGLIGVNDRRDTTAPAGTSLVWLDGWPAGELIDDTKFKKLAGVRDRVCLEFTLAESKLQACMDEGAAAPIKD